MSVLKDPTYAIEKLKTIHPVIKVFIHIKNKITSDKNVFHNAVS